MIPEHFVQVANSTDQPLVSGVDYSCGVPHTGGAVKACTLRAAFYYCYSLDRYRTAATPTLCYIKMPPPPTVGAVFSLYPETIIYSPSLLSKMVNIVLDGNGWTFRPTTKRRASLGFGVYTTFPFLQSDTVLDYYQEIKLESPAKRRRLSAAVGEDEGGAGVAQGVRDGDEEGVGYSGMDEDPSAQTHIQEKEPRQPDLAGIEASGLGLGLGLAGLEAAGVNVGAGSAGGSSSSYSFSHDPSHSMMSYRSPLGGLGGLKGRRLLTYNPQVPYINNTYYLELRNVTFAGFGGVLLTGMVTNDIYYQFSGSVLSIKNIGTVVFRGVTFSNNVGAIGGAVSLVNTSSVIMTDTVFASNTAQSGAGFFASNGIEFTLNRVSFLNNTATNFQGGGFFVDGAVAVIVKGSTFTGNTALPYTPTGFPKNPYTLGGFGGGAAVHSVYNLLVTNSTFRCNKAQNGGALAIGGYGLNVNPVAVGGQNYTRIKSIVRYNNFLANDATAAGGAIFWINSTVMLPPSGLGTNTYRQNKAVYGNNRATEAVRLQPEPVDLYITQYVANPPNPNVANLKTTIPPVLVSRASVQDFYGQIVTTDSNSSATVTLDRTIMQLGCGTQLDFVALIGTQDASTTRGVMVFNGAFMSSPAYTPTLTP